MCLERVDIRLIQILLFLHPLILVLTMPLWHVMSLYRETEPIDVAGSVSFHGGPRVCLQPSLGPVAEATGAFAHGTPKGGRTHLTHTGREESRQSSLESLPLAGAPLATHP